MSLVLSPDSISLNSLSDISFPNIRTYTSVLSPNSPNLSLSPTSFSLKTTLSPPYSINNFSTLSTLSTLSALSPLTTNGVYTPLSNSIMGLGGIANNGIALLKVRPSLYVNVDVDTGLNESYVVQKDVTKYFMYKTIDKWIYSDFSSVLKYLTYKDGKVSLVKKIDDKDSNDVSKDSKTVLEAKADYIEENVLSESKTRLVLIRIMKELGLKWYELPHQETLVKEVIERYLKKKLKKMILGEDDD